MVKGKKKTFLQFNEANAALLASQKKEGGAADKPAALSKKPPRPPRQQHSLETSESSAENIAHLSLHDSGNYPDPIQADLAFSPPLKAVEPVATNTPSYGNIVKGDVKANHKKERPYKPETQSNPDHMNKHTPSNAMPNEEPKSTAQDSTNPSELPPNQPLVKNVWNIPDPPLSQEPISQATNWVRSAPPVSTPKPFGANLDPLTVSVPSEPLTVNVPSQTEPITEVNVHTPLSATLNVDAPVFQPKSVHNIPEFVPQQVEIPASAPENVEYAYDENTAHQQAYSEPIYTAEVPQSNAMVPEFYSQLTPVIPQPIIPYLPSAEIGFHPGYTMSVPISNPAEVHHISSDLPPNYIPDSAWPQQHIYHDEQIDPSRDPLRDHRGVYPNQAGPNRNYYNNRFDGRRNSGQPRYPPGSYPTTNSRRDSQNSEVSDHSYNNRGGPPNRYQNDRDFKRNSRPPRNDTRPEYQQSRQSNNNHNKNRDQNHLRPNDSGECRNEKPPEDDWDSVPGDVAQQVDEQLACPVQNHQEAQSSNLPGNSYDQHQSKEDIVNNMHEDTFNRSSGSIRSDRTSTENENNWRSPYGKGNPKDSRLDKDRTRHKREEGGGTQSVLDRWLGLNKDGSHEDKEFSNWARHWEDYQKFTNIEEVSKDLFAMGEEYSLAHCVAEDMRMGSGIAVTFKRDFKKQDDLLEQRAKQGGLAVLEPSPGRFIYYLVTKKQSVGKPTYYTMWSSLKKMKEHIEENNVKKLAIPRIGCGLDRLEWTKVKSMMQHLFEGLNVHITVCNFQQNEDQQLTSSTSPPTPRLFNSCKTVIASYPVCEIDTGTIIIFLSTETGHVNQEMQDLDKKFNFLKKFQTAEKKQGDIFLHEDLQKNYVLCGCIVRKSPKDRLDFFSLAKCVSAVNKYNRAQGYEYVGFQTVVEKDYHEADDLNSRIITILINYLKKVDVYICGGSNAKREE